MKTKIAIVISNLEYGGAQKMVSLIIKNINRLLFDIHLFVRDSKLQTSLEDDIENLNIHITYLNLNKPGDFFSNVNSYFKFSREMKAYDPDIIHVHLEPFLAYTYCIFHKTKIITTIHSWPDRISGKRFRFYTKYLYRKHNGWIVGCAECVSDRMLELYPYMKGRIKTIYNPVDGNQVNDHIAHEGIKFVNIGRLTKIKNQDLLIRTFKRVVEKYPECSLEIIGTGELDEQLKNLAEELDISDNVIFLGTTDKVYEHLANSDVFVLSSDSECCPMVILESMAAGIPVISTDVGGVSELISDCGILVSAGNSNELEEAMERLIKNREYKKILGERSKQISNFYESKIITSEYEKLYTIVSKHNLRISNYEIFHYNGRYRGR